MSELWVKQVLGNSDSLNFKNCESEPCTNDAILRIALYYKLSDGCCVWLKDCWSTSVKLSVLSKVVWIYIYIYIYIYITYIIHTCVYIFRNNLKVFLGPILFEIEEIEILKFSPPCSEAKPFKSLNRSQRNLNNTRVDLLELKCSIMITSF